MRIVRGTKTLAIALLKDESGASLLEYSVLVGLITAAVITAITTVGGQINAIWTTLITTLTPLAPPA
jgi:pilus assembly protein Flp/PilA